MENTYNSSVEDTDCHNSDYAAISIQPRHYKKWRGNLHLVVLY